MLSTAHTIISLPFGLLWQNPWLVFVTAFIFHFFLDAIYHWNIFPHQYRKVSFFLLAGVDVVSGLIIAGLLLGNNVFNITVVAAIAGGNLPDVMQAAWEFLGRPRSNKINFTFLFDLHDKIQWETTTMWKGLIPQFLLAVTIILFILR